MLWLLVDLVGDPELSFGLPCFVPINSSRETNIQMKIMLNTALPTTKEEADVILEIARTKYNELEPYSWIYETYVNRDAIPCTEGGLCRSKLSRRKSQAKIWIGNNTELLLKLSEAEISPVEGVKEQIEALHSKKVIRYVVEGDMVYVNGRKKADYKLDVNNIVIAFEDSNEE